MAALGALHRADAEKKHVMGLLYFDGEKPSLDADLDLHDTPITEMGEDILRPSREKLADVVAALRG